MNNPTWRYQHKESRFCYIISDSNCKFQSVEFLKASGTN